MSKSLISVIVPVYKVENFLDRCVESIVGQTYENLEIILVDDGSPDNCPAMCDKWAEKDGRIKVIHKENGGVSSARNAALDIVSGDYICFVDSDDWIDPGMYEFLYKNSQKYDADISCCGIFDDYDDGRQTYYGIEYTDENGKPQYFDVCAISFEEAVGIFAIETGFPYGSITDIFEE